MKFNEYAKESVDQILKNFNSFERGISASEAEKRLKIYGFNELEVKKGNTFDIFIRQFKSPFFYLLFVASIIAFLLGEIIDTFLIFLFIAINVGLGFFQEFKAEKAVALLKKYLPATARVLRNGKEKSIEKRFLVPGDIILLEPGDIVPADARILKVENFLIDESILTGESAPISKNAEALPENIGEIFQAKNIIFAGTSVISGEAEGIVIKTGKETFFGEITKMVSNGDKKSSYEKGLVSFSRIITKIVVSTIIALFLFNLALHGTANFSTFLLFCIALTVSILPETLPLVVTFNLSRGALKLAKQKVIVKRLSAIEDLGNIEILCTDKTGTITENKLSLVKINSFDEKKCLQFGLLASAYVKEQIESTFNPFDLAIFEKAPEKIRQSLGDFEQISEISFNSVRMMSSVIVRGKDKKSFLIARGAPENILKISSKIYGNVEDEIKEEGKKGRRVLAVAFREINKQNYTETDEKNLIFLGYFSFVDPVKKTTKSTISLSKKLGLKIKILSGDSKEVSGAVAKDIGLIKYPEEVILGSEMECLTKEDFDNACEKFSVFARISPEMKLKIINSLRKKYGVGFLGEGFNDAPALKSADVAIAVARATDVARESSDIILLEKSLHAIIEGIKEGRNVFCNINKYIKCTLISNFGNFYSIAVISLFIPFLPMLPIQILLNNLLTDFPLIAIITDSVDVEELRRPKLYKLDKTFPLIIFLALVSTIFDFIFFAIFYKSQPEVIQTLWFIESILTEIFLIFSIRTRYILFKAKKPSSPLLLFSILSVILGTALPFTYLGQNFFHFIHPPIAPLLIIMFLVGSYFLLNETIKLIYFQRWGPKIYAKR